jgi:hypothetical protein
MPEDMADRVAAEARRLLAVAQAEPQQQRGPTKTVRFAKGSDLLAWYEAYASDSDSNLSTNGAILLALMTFRAAVERGERKENHP